MRFRALEEVATNGEFFTIEVEGPPGCGKIETNSLGVRYRARRGGALPGEAVHRATGKSAKRWCRGVYRGSVSFEQVLAAGCGPAALPAAAGCTMGIRVGSFSFRVR